jgi:uncharacterized RDD family membrane protein YckC
MEIGKQEGLRLKAVIEGEYDRLYERLKLDEAAAAVRWGGFFRRLSAFTIDIYVLTFFSLLLFYLSRIGFRVGMAAHQRTISWEMIRGVVGAVGVAWLALLCSYFVVLHGQAGKTVGEWLLGLCVVDARREPIGYRRALLPCIFALVTAPLILGYLRILWHREKRGWHDSISRTWVIRE